MSNPVEFTVYTVVGSIRMQMQEEAIEKLPSYKAVIEPKDGRGRLVAALMFWSQEIMSGDDTVTLLDVDDSVWTVRGSAIHAVQIPESGESENRETKAIGFRATLPPPAL